MCSGRPGQAPPFLSQLCKTLQTPPGVALGLKTQTADRPWLRGTRSCSPPMAGEWASCCWPGRGHPVDGDKEVTFTCCALAQESPETLFRCNLETRRSQPSRCAAVF